jgi:hypothetical protein
VTRTDADKEAFDATAEVDIVADVARFDVNEIQRRRDSIDALASNRVQSAEAADDFGGDEHVNFVDGSGVEERPQKRAASFDQHVGHTPAAELVEQCANRNRVMVIVWFGRIVPRRSAYDHFNTGSAQPIEILLRSAGAGGDHEWEIARRLH